MRALLPLVLLLAALSAEAQSGFDPTVVLDRMGAPWAEVKAVVPAPDSGRVVGKTGDLLILTPDDEFTRILFSVRDGRLARFEVTVTPAERNELEDLDAEFRRQAGAPEAGRFYSADQVRRLGGPGEVPVEVSIDAEAGVLVVRVADSGD